MASRLHHPVISILFLLSLVPAAVAFAWLWPDWLHAGHPLTAARPQTRAAAAAAACESESGPDICRPLHFQSPSNEGGQAQDWPELRSILSAIYPTTEEPQPPSHGTYVISLDDD